MSQNRQPQRGGAGLYGIPPHQSTDSAAPGGYTTVARKRVILFFSECAMLTDKPLSLLVDGINAGQIDPCDLVDACLAAIEKHEPDIAAWVVVDAEGARRQASDLRRRIQSGGDGGLLAGIPVGIKDIVDLKGFRTLAGSPLRDSDEYLAHEDAPVVARLRQAGAIVLGKTVTTQFACFDPPPTRNPWNAGHTPGGSSSGSAAAVAAGMCVAAIGSQTGGSIIRPASYCGVAGLKPSLGALSTRGFTPISPRLDHPGPLARNAAELHAVWQALRNGPARADAAQKESRLPEVFRVKGYFFENANADVAAVTSAAMRTAGIGDAPARELPDSFARMHEMHWRIMQVDAAAYHRPVFTSHRGSYAPKVASLIEGGLKLPASSYAEAIAFQRKFTAAMEAWLGDAIAVMPATDVTAPASLNTTGDAAFQSPWSFTGQPSVTVPCSVTGGMPCGLQLVASRGREDALLQTAIKVERSLAFTPLQLE